MIKRFLRSLTIIRPSVPVYGTECTDDSIVLTPSANASVDYLVLPHLDKIGLSACVVNARTNDPRSILPGNARTVVIVRFLFKNWLPWLESFRANGGRIVYFMDDDLMDSDAVHGLPKDYVKAIRQFSLSQRAIIERLCHDYWVGSPHLARKYECWKPTTLQAATSTGLLRDSPGISICYHGTASHQAELSWLLPVLRAVLEGNPSANFEVFGDYRINRAYRDLPRVAVLHPMSWPNYVSYTTTVTRNIALAPLLPTPFNAARGITKFFDFARMGAVGIYSKVEPYQDFVRHGVDGMLVENESEAWSEAISWLVKNTVQRETMAAAARSRAKELVWR